MIGLKSTPQLIAERLLEEIREGKYLPGQTLNQGDLADRFGISRIPIREALRQLESDGAIVYLPNRGASVASYSLEEIKERFEIRGVLEPLAIGLALAHLSDADLAKAHQEHLAMKEVREAKFWGKHHAAFHSALYEPAGRPRLCAMIDSLYVDFIAMLPGHTEFEEFRKTQQRDHDRILKKCRERDEIGARKALSVHLSSNCAIIIARAEKNAATAVSPK